MQMSNVRRRKRAGQQGHPSSQDAWVKRDWPLERAGQDRGAAGIRKRTFIRVGLDVPTKGAP